MPVRTMLADRIVIDDPWFEIGHDTADINMLLPEAYEKYSYAWVNNRLFAKEIRATNGWLLGPKENQR